MSGLFDKTTQALGTAANLRLLRNDVISSNIANAETPGYHAKKVDFEGELARALDIDKMRSIEASHPNHFPRSGTVENLKATIQDNPDAPVNQDGNTVNLEKEMAGLAENTIMYKAAIQLMNKKLAALRYAATEGR